jgi:hypothetical protein
VNFRRIIVCKFEECFRKTEGTLPVFGFKILNFLFSFYGNRKFYGRKLKSAKEVIRKNINLGAQTIYFKANYVIPTTENMSNSTCHNKHEQNEK